MNVIYIGLFICVILFIAWFFVSPPQKELYETMSEYFTPDREHDTIYYRVTDVNGVISAVHDSGVKPSSLKKGDEFTINVLKEEYDNEKKVKIGIPNTIEYGSSIFDLKNKLTIPGDLKAMKLYYRIKILYGG